MQNYLFQRHFGRLVIHTPHAGTILPLWLHSRPEASRRNYELKKFIEPFFLQLTDHYTDKLFSADSLLSVSRDTWGSDPLIERVKQVSFPYSRLFCDVERLEHDPLEEKGLGICYDFKKIVADCPWGSIWDYDKEQALQLYKEHQTVFVNSLKGMWQPISTLILDCHSFSERDNVLCPNAHEYEKLDICIGYNEDKSKPSEDLLLLVRDFFYSRGYNVAFNVPFSNSKTDYWQTTSLMLEVNKHCYMNEDTLTVTAGYYKLHSELQILYSLLLGL